MKSITPTQKKDFQKFLESQENRGLKNDSPFYTKCELYEGITDGKITDNGQYIYTTWVKKQHRPIWDYYFWEAIQNYIKDTTK